MRPFRNANTAFNSAVYRMTPMRISGALMRFVVAFLIVSLSMPAPAQADGAKIYSVEEEGTLRVEVEHVHLQSFSTLERLQGQISLKVAVTNLGDAPLDLKEYDLKATCAGEDARVNMGIASPLIARSEIKIPASETAEGWLGIPVRHPSSTEPPVTFSIEVNGKSLTVSVNDAIRKTTNTRVRTLGPQDILSVVTLHRTLDGLAVWILQDTFQQIKKAGGERVIVEFEGDVLQQGLASSSVSTNAVNAWLQSASLTAAQWRMPFGISVQSPVKFEKLLIVQPATSRRMTYSPAANLRRDNLDTAIADSLRDVFRVLSPDAVDAAFRSPESGIRRVVLETNLDRLADAELKTVVEQAQGDSEKQKLLASLLHRSPSPLALEFCEEYVRSDVPEVSQAAMNSIIKSPSRNAASTALRLWNEFKGRQAWETDLVNAILKEGDHRFVQILTDYAETRLTAYATPKNDSQEIEPEQPSEPPADVPDGPLAEKSSPSPFSESIRRSQVEASTLPRVLRFLRNVKDSDFEDFAMNRLLAISDPAIQDIVLGFVLESKKSELADIVRQYIAQRLPQQSSSQLELTDEERRLFEQKYSPQGMRVVSRRYTSTLFEATRKYPRPEYTERLFELSEDKALSSSSRTNAFMAAVEGATPDQMAVALKDFDDFARQRRTQILTVLAGKEHDGWLALAERSLRKHEDTRSETINLLQKNGSLEAILVVVEFLNDIRRKIERMAGRKEKLTDPETQKSLRLFQAAPSLYQWSHPRIRQFLNALHRSSAKQLHELGRGAMRNRLMSSRSRPQMEALRELRVAGKNKEAEKLCLEMLEADPFQDEVMTSLASLCMRDDRPEEAMELLQKAIRISPGDVDTESFIALALIRLGDVEAGIRKTEQTIQSVPNLDTYLRANALYNAACSYSRAAEKAENDASRERFQQKALDYLQQSIEHDPGFSEVDHTLVDPDLKPLHDLPRWAKLLDQMRKKAAEIPKP